MVRDDEDRTILDLGALTLEYADEANKGEGSADNLRSQIQGYLEDAARARTDAEIAKREAERLAKELSALRAANR